MPPEPTTEQLLAQAGEALGRAEWRAAKALFAEALDREETPEALEGLGTAAFFLDEAELALAVRERAFSGYRAAGRVVDAARVATALAWDYRAFRGERAVAGGWLARARRLLEGRGPTREQGWVALREASFALPGDAALARERCAEAEALARELGDVDLEMTAVALDGLARVSQGEVAEGMARLDEATTAATAGEMRDPLAIGFSCCYLIFACERVRDFERAGQWCERVARMASGWNIRALRSVCRSHYGTVLMLRGEWSTAEVVLSEAAAALAARPAEARDALARLAELRRRQGETEKALALLAQAEHHPIAVLTEAAIALERGDPAAAADGALRYLRLVDRARTERAPGLEVAAEAHAAAGRAAEAEAAARELRSIAAAAGTDPLLGAASQAEGLAHAAGGRLEQAREALEDAVELLGRAGLPFEAARARVALATALRALGREDGARRELELARERFAALGAAAEERRAGELRAGRGRKGRPPLSRREAEILGLVAQGLSNRQIAERLVLSEHTVHRHVANILRKLGLSSRASAAAFAAKHGLAE
ncbi:MAG TPA: LuxR C-terminal-related transcriptional regulator [Gaiellaceae bacterium]|nr:LuxR C-terminal-related transcriptional regulator [Gaiellaceae bacterium]